MWFKLLGLFISWVPFTEFLKLFKKRSKYKVHNDHLYFDVMKTLRKYRFANLEKEFGFQKSALLRRLLVDYMTNSFEDWGRETLKFLKTNSKLPEINTYTMWDIINRYRAQAILEWERDYDGNRAMSVLIKGLHEQRKIIIDLTFSEIEMIMKKDFNEDTKLDLVFEILSKTFMKSFDDFEAVVKRLNGALTKEIKKWNNGIIQKKNIYYSKKQM